MEDDLWLLTSLKEAQEEALKFPAWRRAVTNAIDEYYGRNAPNRYAPATDPSNGDNNGVSVEADLAQQHQ